ncbi:hypothetical protein GDO78_010543 [Eleutherodactylus coqui]|uniref:Uncharacterized protein n=1 Tax=Eleutherodactylus coqui TaxID=57060 RepID=A0A8J6K6V8_ELECQ|nr:hypothetical protein GDO78_010543 [Eleutherodactylus coqui]
MLVVVDHQLAKGSFHQVAPNGSIVHYSSYRYGTAYIRSSTFLYFNIREKNTILKCFFYSIGAIVTFLFFRTVTCLFLIFTRKNGLFFNCSFVFHVLNSIKV